MAGLSAELVIRLRDHVSATARSISASLRGIGAAAKSINGATANVGRSASRDARAAHRSLAPIAGTLRGIGTAAGVYGLGHAVTGGFRDYADTERRLTRIMNTAEAARADMAGVLGGMQRLAAETAMPLDKVVGGLDTLVQQGRNLKDSLSFLPAVVRSAQASGAEVDDIAKSADAVATHLKVSGREMQSAFDIMQAGGKAGQFELKDMSRYLPSILPAVRAIGLEGTKGLTQVVAMLQVMRTGAGTSEEAATNFENVLQKMQSNETIKKFEKQGVDLERVLADARKEGKNLLDVFGDVTWKTLGGDLSKINKLFEDMQVQKGMRAWLMGRDKLKTLMRDIERTAPGSTMKDLAMLTGDAAAAIQRLSNGWSSFWRGAARVADSAGASSALQKLGEMAEEAARKMENKPWSPEEVRRANDQEAAEKADIRYRQLEDKVKRAEASEAEAKADLGRGRPFARWRLSRVQDELRGLREEREVMRLAIEAAKLGPARPITTDEELAIGKRKAAIDKVLGGGYALRPGLMLPRTKPEPAKPWTGGGSVPAMGFDGSVPLPGGPGVKPAAPYVGPDRSAAPRTGIKPAAPIKLDEIKTKAVQAEQALSTVDSKTVSPTVDTSSIDAAIQKVQQLIGQLTRASGMVVSPTITPRIAPASGGGSGALNDYPRTK